MRRVRRDCNQTSVFVSSTKGLREKLHFMDSPPGVCPRCFGRKPGICRIVVTAPTASSNGSFQITTDITFAITTSGTAHVFLLDEWVTSDNSWTFSNYSPDLQISVNNGASGAYAGRFADNFNSFGFQLSPNDGYLVTNAVISVTSGDNVTLKAGTYSLGSVEGFNPQANQTFTGNMFLTDVIGVRLSDIVALPEPSTFLLMLSAGLVMSPIRRARRG